MTAFSGGEERFIPIERGKKEKRLTLSAFGVLHLGESLREEGIANIFVVPGKYSRGEKKKGTWDGNFSGQKIT